MKGNWKIKIKRTGYKMEEREKFINLSHTRYGKTWGQSGWCGDWTSRNSHIARYPRSIKTGSFTDRIYGAEIRTVISLN